MYTKTITLKDNEAPAKIDKETGEFIEIKQRYNNIPKDKEIFEPGGIFKKDYSTSWRYLRDNLSALEFRAAYSLVLLAHSNTNSLQPLSDDTAYSELTTILGVSKNRVDKVLKTLWEYGVYGKFEIYDEFKPYTKYWVLNPYLSFAGKLITSDIARLFRGTKIAKAYLKEERI